MRPSWASSPLVSTGGDHYVWASHPRLSLEPTPRPAVPVRTAWDPPAGGAAARAGAGEYQRAPLRPTGRARQVWLPLEAVARSQEHRQEATATSEWSVTTKKCHAAGIMVRRGLYFTCAQSMWANLLERQLGISSRTDDEINWGGACWPGRLP